MRLPQPWPCWQHSSNSFSGTLSATIPAPDWMTDRGRFSYRPGGWRCRCPGFRQNPDIRWLRRKCLACLFSSSSMIWQARIFGAPERVPAGRIASTASTASLSSRIVPRHGRADVHDVGEPLDRTCDLSTFTEPIRLILPRSFRPRSTSMLCSAQLFFILQKLCFKRSCPLPASFPLGRVPASGKVLQLTVVQLCQRLRGSARKLDVVCWRSKTCTATGSAARAAPGTCSHRLPSASASSSGLESTTWKDIALADVLFGFFPTMFAVLFFRGSAGVDLCFPGCSGLKASSFAVRGSAPPCPSKDSFAGLIGTLRCPLRHDARDQQ